VRDLSAHQLLDFSQSRSGSQWSFVTDERSISHQPETRFRVNTADAAIAAALDGRGLTRVLSYLVVKDIAEGAT